MLKPENFHLRIQNVKAQCPISSVADRLGITRHGSRLFCPACQPSGSSQHKTPDLVLYESNFKCFRCGEFGDVIKLVQVTLKCSFKEAVAFLIGDTLPNNGRWSRRHTFPKIFSPKPEDVRSSPQVTGNIKTGVAPEKLDHSRIFRLSQGLLLESSLAIKYLETRGFEFNTVKHLLGFLRQGQWINSKRESPTGRLVFPQLSSTQIVNLYGRALEPCPKWLCHDIGSGPKGFWSPNPAKTLSSGVVALTEGPFDALALHCSDPDLPVAAVFGTQSFRFENFPNARKIIFAFDNDHAGAEAFKKLALEGLLRGVEIFRLPLPVYRGCKDLAEAFQKNGLLDFTIYT